MLHHIFLNVCEIFYSLQGEGPYIGTPCIFLRLGGCIPPFCPWCDTKYAWKDFEKLSLFDIIQKIKSYGKKNIVITGGEPFLQWNQGLKVLISNLEKMSFFIQFETSGKIEIPSETPGIIVCSPKFLNEKWHFLDSNIPRCDFFKFVANGKNFSSILNFIKRKKISKEKIYIMPEGSTKEEQLKKMIDVFKFCKEYGFKMTPRLHVLCFGNKKGV
jgi:7-carboxy-7-deazaguanine synthase